MVDAIDTMSRMSDRVMLEAGTGISRDLEDLLLNTNDEKVEDLVASALCTVLSILEPLKDQKLAETSGRQKRDSLSL